MKWIIGGTSESRVLLNRIKDYDNFIMTIATEDGLDFFDSDRVIVGRLNREEMISFIKTYNIDTVIDLSHPYAKIVTENAKDVSRKIGIRYIRYVRKKIELQENEIYLDSYEDCYEYLKEITGAVFFTTGSKNIKDFEKVRKDNRFIYRVLPALESLEICKKNKIHMRDIVAILGPFSKELNRAMLKDYGVDYCIMKDSGDVGGTMEKIIACRELDITPIIIGREEEEGITDLDDIVKIIKNEIIYNRDRLEVKIMENSYRFYRNLDCNYFPCHKVEKEEEFNCMFCYCPLYLLEDCGGNYENKYGIKDCTNCLVPHRPKGYDHINKKIMEYNEKKMEDNLK